jgi:hypothetical protein
VARRTVGGGTGAAVSLHQLFDADLDQVGISLRCTGTAGAIAETVVEFRGATPGCEVDVQGEPRIADEDGPLPPAAHSTLSPPVPRASARCTATTRTGARCKLKAGQDGLCPLHQPQEPQLEAT